MQMLRQGSKGPEVRLLQQALNMILPGPQPLVLDGLFGPLTAGRARDFQARRGLTPDGIVGPLTLGALIQGARVTTKITLERPPATAPQPSPQHGPFTLRMRPPAPTVAPPRPALRLTGGPAFTPFGYDPADALWVQEMREWLTWLSLPPGAANKP
ncbi:MAG TPA: peptidoglycan-binding domain-containing protein, partial [Acetobacteraceae bacterium]|nr:peptidoglycan-binding domain-containing protein [Acetobacteraceae bacterium]